MKLSKKQKIAVFLMLLILPPALALVTHVWIFDSAIHDGESAESSNLFNGDAEEAYNRALEEARRWNDTKEIYKSLEDLAAVEHYHNSYAESAKHFAELRDLVKKRKIGDWQNEYKRLTEVIKNVEADQAKEEAIQANFAKQSK